MLRQFLSLNICIGCISIAIGSNTVLAGYYPQPIVPDYYDIVTIPCYYHKPYYKYKKYGRHPTHYFISKYYLYNTPTGHLIKVPIQKDGCRAESLAIARHRNNYQGFSEAPYSYRETESYVNEPIDENFVMDRRTSDDVLDDFE
ncbi:MAG: hypothetical protein K0R24_1931 [Gammaproteobacteria bacterium]|jgi:hypothetical protein|nr:hypothetical protein [Gammaproteobacteria bacterium]